MTGPMTVAAVTAAADVLNPDATGALVVVLIIAAALVLLLRSLNRHLKRVPRSFAPPPDRGTPDRGTPDRGTPDRGTSAPPTPRREGGGAA